MPIGKTVEMWVICDRCEKILSYDPGCNGSIKKLTAEVRAMGWTVRSTGEAICPKCKQKGVSDNAKRPD